MQQWRPKTKSAFRKNQNADRKMLLRVVLPPNTPARDVGTNSRARDALVVVFTRRVKTLTTKLIFFFLFSEHRRVCVSATQQLVEMQQEQLRMNI